MVLCYSLQIMYFVSSSILSHEIMPQWPEILNGKSNSLFASIPINKPLHHWKCCSSCYHFVSTCHKAVNNEHHLHLSWNSLTNMCLRHSVSRLYKQNILLDQNCGLWADWLEALCTTCLCHWTDSRVIKLLPQRSITNCLYEYM